MANGLLRRWCPLQQIMDAASVWTYLYILETDTEVVNRAGEQGGSRWIKQESYVTVQFVAIRKNHRSFIRVLGISWRSNWICDVTATTGSLVRAARTWWLNCFSAGDNTTTSDWQLMKSFSTPVRSLQYFTPGFAECSPCLRPQLLPNSSALRRIILHRKFILHDVSLIEDTSIKLTSCKSYV